MSTLCSTLLTVLLLLCCMNLFTVFGKIQQQSENTAFVPLATSDQEEATSVANLSRDDFPCIDDSLIAPCTCQQDDWTNNKIRLDCTLAESNEQFASVFQQPWPVKELSELYMRGNLGVTVLGNVLNGFTFESINIYNGPFVLEGISEYFLLDCKSTLTDIRLENTLITSDFFPFATFSQMEKLETLRISRGPINWIPPLLAPQLTTVSIDFGLLTIINSGTFPIYAGHTAIFLGDNAIHTVEPGSFTLFDKDSIDSQEDITYSIGRNALTSLQAGTFPVRNGNMTVDVPYNQISYIEPGAIVLPKTTDSLKLEINLYDNQLSTFDEEVFGELLPFMDRVRLYGNPLLCGCDIAWILLDAEKLDKIDDSARCASGELLHDLDPAPFEDLC